AGLARGVSQALFPAWRPRAAEAERLQSLVHALRDQFRARGLGPRSLRRPDQWHVTLCFLGHGEHATPALLDALALAATRVPPHAFRMARIAYWPGPGVVVALPATCPELQALCDATRDAGRRAGIAPLQATTQPHITLAHLERGLPPQAWLDGIDCAATGAFEVDRFELLFNPGGRYQALRCWTLTGTGLPRAPEQGTLL